VSERETLGRTQWAVLALLAEEPSHGWALSRALDGDGEIGQIWGGDRYGVYRALRMLSTLGLAEAIGIERGEGGHRTMYRATPEGVAAVGQWLAEPVEHVRDINAMFLLKVAFAQRSGLDVRPLLSTQREILEGLVANLAGALEAASPEEPNLHLRLRLEIAQTVLRFLNGLELPPPEFGAARGDRSELRLGAAGARSGGGHGSGRGDGSGRRRSSL
jgi:DNA-binding PadR family transcriptional regulator